MTKEAPLIFHDTELGAKRLLAQPRDLQLGNVAEIPLETAPRSYRELFLSYVDELDRASAIAIAWWNNLVRRSMERDSLDEMQAMRFNYEQRPAGPASRPEVVFVVRDYWLRVVALNHANRGQTGVAPQILLLGWLPGNGHLDPYGILTAMPYWPIGLDENGNWC
ncbi:hypothetical protein FJ960_13680 [Mesorhizobium sp. B2-3-11]|uniref:hypothetical protein n=1 Tax=Mesorhizobium sp. B2-3-11 TaxID=2589953 RepID=UPI001128861D|nr:hypothetical protein [Mesorhizobium sp. B2-3-11]TPM05439.1 hypothetical protein FJ960_13680 [Mesorhizobium sp. B2-3-11]